MEVDLDKFLRRPRTWTQLLARSNVAKSTLTNRLKKYQHTEMNLYWKRTWFKDLGDKWTCHDVAQHCALIFDAWLTLDMVKDDSNPENVTQMARRLSQASSQLKGYSDILYSRLEDNAEESIEETEVAE